MIIDFLLAILVAIAILKGLQKGFIMAVVSGIAFFIGILLGIKFSATIANKLMLVTGNYTWLPLLAFSLIVITTGIVLKIKGKFLQKLFRLLSFGWLDKLAGIALFLSIYLCLLSIALFYIVQMQLLSANYIEQSVTYPYIKNIGVMVIENAGKIVPIFKGLFHQLEVFFTAKVMQ